MIKRNCLYETNFENGILEVRLRGEIDHHSAVRIRTEMDEKILKFRPKKTVIDLSGIEFMDSSGLGLIMGRYMKMQAVGGVLLLRNPNERILKIFKLAGLERIVKIEESENVFESEGVLNESK